MARLYWETGDVVTTAELPQDDYVCRVAYASFSLGYGRSVPPLGLLVILKPSYHRHHPVPDCNLDFLFDVWAEVDLADPSENRGQ